MRLWRTIVLGVRTLLHRREADRDLADEVRHYLQEAEDERVAAGATRAEARRAVRLAYGDELPAREDVRASGWENAVDRLVSDVRIGARSLRRSPAFTIVVVLTLGVGVGAATAIFSAVRPVLFEPLAYPHAGRILAVSDQGPDGTVLPPTFGTYLEVAARSRVFDALAVLKPWQPTLTGEAEPERLEAQSVSAGYFDVLGVRPALGPGFDADEDRPGGARQVLLSDALWRARLGGDIGAVGRPIRLDGEAYTVVGILPPTFENVTSPQARAWTLLQYDPIPSDFEAREWGHHLTMIGRVRAGMSIDNARTALDGIAGRAVPEFPRPAWADLGRGFTVRRLRDAVTADARPTMLVFVGAVALLLVVTCANLTLLLLARGARRRSEFAMRVALGAERARLARYLVTESLLLAAAGGLVGVGLAQVGLSALLSASPPSLPRLDAIRLDGLALALAFGLTTLVGVIFGLAPGLHRADARPEAIREAGRGFARRSRKMRGAMVVTELALAMVLLVGAGLLLRSTRHLFALPLGFDPSGMAVVQVYATGLEHGDAVTHRFFDQALDAVRSVPGVVSAAETSQLPLSGEGDTYGITLGDVGEAESVSGAAYRYAVSPGYLATMGTAVERGRALTDDDLAGTTPVAVVSRRLAERLFQGREAIGRTFHFGPVGPEPFRIVGVVDDVKQASLDAEDSEAVYVSSRQWHWADRVRWIVVRTEGDPMTLVPSIRRAVWSVDAAQPVVRARSMEDMVARSEARRRFVLGVIAAFAAAALALAVIGLYGVVSGMVVERLPEMGVRAALGASRERIVGLVVRQGMLLAAAGVALGLGGAVAASAMLATLLFEVSRLDPITYAAVAGLLMFAAALACSIPAARAARVDPVRTLNAD